MIGMVAFIVDIPQGFSDPATVLPVQIFLWADSPERAFIEKTSAAIHGAAIIFVDYEYISRMVEKTFRTPLVKE